MLRQLPEISQREEPGLVIKPLHFVFNTTPFIAT